MSTVDNDKPKGNEPVKQDEAPSYEEVFGDLPVFFEGEKKADDNAGKAPDAPSLPPKKEAPAPKGEPDVKIKESGGSVAPVKDKKKPQETPAKKADKTSGKEPAGDKKLVKKSSASKEKTQQEKSLFILAMCLVAPFALILAVLIVAVFLVLFLVCAAVMGAFALALVAIVAAGVLLAVFGITYGVATMITGSGFTAVAGQYELGLGLLIAGVTIIISALLYSGITALVPFVAKKLWKLLTLIFKKLKDLVVGVYKRATGRDE